MVGCVVAVIGDNCGEVVGKVEDLGAVEIGRLVGKRDGVTGFFVGVG